MQDGLVRRPASSSKEGRSADPKHVIVKGNLGERRNHGVDFETFQICTVSLAMLQMLF